MQSYELIRQAGAEQASEVEEPAVNLLSIVVPCFNEEEVIVETYRRLTDALRDLDMSIEFLFVDDGSTDRTRNLLLELATGDNRVRPVLLSRNFGHQAAVTAGLDLSRGDAIALIDADLQDPPELIPEMVAHWRSGFEVVYGVRAKRAGESAWKLATASGFYRLLNQISEIPIPLDTGDFRLMDRRVAEVLRSMPERDRFLRGMVAWTGFRQLPLSYARHARFAGTTKYPLRKMVLFALDGIVSFSVAPLRLATWFGFASASLAFLGVIYALVARLATNSWVPGWAAIFVGIMFLGGIQLIALGIIGEYVGRLYLQGKHRPLYVLDGTVGTALTPRRMDSSARSI